MINDTFLKLQDKKDMQVNILTRTDGKGRWSEEKRDVLITKIKISYNSQDFYPEEKFSGELRAYFDGSGIGNGWLVPVHGLIYTDKTWLKEFKKGLKAEGFSRRALSDISYSEQGMQGDNYVSLDIGKDFYASWKRLLKEGHL